MAEKFRQTVVVLSELISSPVPRSPESTNDYVARCNAQAPLYPKDRLLFLPRAELVILPVIPHRDGEGWDVVVVAARKDSQYGPGGHRLYVGAAELATAVPLDILVTAT